MLRLIKKKHKRFFVSVLALACLFFAGCTQKSSERQGIKSPSAITVVERFDSPVTAVHGKEFGQNNFLTFELYRGGTFDIKGNGVAVQKSDHYGDVALIRSSQSLPQAYKLTAIVGNIDYGLEKINNLPADTYYREGPHSENGCYLLAITDEEPVGHHTNDWWHHHRKVVIDVDNNVWGHGMPNPVFMVYFNNNNELRSLEGASDAWSEDWKGAIHYNENAWYQVQIEKTKSEYILRIFDADHVLLRSGRIALGEVWHSGKDYPDYFVIGDPHENYYQGKMEIKKIELEIR